MSAYFPLFLLPLFIFWRLTSALELNGFLGVERALLQLLTAWPPMRQRNGPFCNPVDQSRKLCILLSFLKCGYAYGFCPWATNPGLKILKLKMSKWFTTENLLLLYIYISISWGKKNRELVNVLVLYLNCQYYFCSFIKCVWNICKHTHKHISVYLYTYINLHKEQHY